jgi:RNA polymerase sigma-70 factor (ECF subfamily)
LRVAGGDSCVYGTPKAEDRGIEVTKSMPAELAEFAAAAKNKVSSLVFPLCYTEGNRIRCNVAISLEATWPEVGGRSKMNFAKPSGQLLPSEDLSKLSDEQLIQHVAAGCQDALAVLFDRYQRLVFDVAFRIVRDPGEAEEVVQTVFLDIYRAVANFDPSKGIPKVWILQYAYHRALHRKRHLVSNHFYRWEELETAVEVGVGRSLKGELPEVVRLAEQMLDRLKPRQRAVLEMTYYEGLTAEEIAQRLGLSAHVVRHDLHRGLGALRAALEKKS